MIEEVKKTEKAGEVRSTTLLPLDNLTRKQDAEIKAALFRFITDTHRKL